MWVSSCMSMWVCLYDSVTMGERKWGKCVRMHVHAYACVRELFCSLVSRFEIKLCHQNNRFFIFQNCIYQARYDRTSVFLGWKLHYTYFLLMTINLLRRHFPSLFMIDISNRIYQLHLTRSRIWQKVIFFRLRASRAHFYCWQECSKLHCSVDILPAHWRVGAVPYP